LGSHGGYGDHRRRHGSVFPEEELVVAERDPVAPATPPPTEVADHTRDIYTVANIVTVLRLIIVPFFFAVLISGTHNFGAFLLGLYFGYGYVQSLLGAAGSLVIIMIWIAYSAQIVFFGAKFALVYASAIGKPILPARYAWRGQQNRPKWFIRPSRSTLRADADGSYKRSV
jgi:hypothetical protein